jgi:hypothetical protein
VTPEQRATTTGLARRAIRRNIRADDVQIIFGLTAEEYRRLCDQEAGTQTGLWGMPKVGASDVGDGFKVVSSKVFCEQCDKLVDVAAAKACTAKYCKVAA